MFSPISLSQTSRVFLSNLSFLAQNLSSFKEMPSEAELAAEVDVSLEHVYQSYFPVSRLWTLRNQGRLMTEVDASHVQGQRGGEITFTTGQMPGWRMRETNLMQLMTLLRRTCSLGEAALDKLRPQLISLAEDANPIITRGRFFAIMEIMASGMGVKGNDVDTMERMSRVFNVKGDLRLTFHEMLDGLAILLGGTSEQKFELYFLMYHHVDPRRVGSGALLDRQSERGMGQSHAAASHFCVYKMMTEINRQLFDPVLEHTGLEAKFWRKKAAEEISSFVDDMRCSGHQMLTFSQLWTGLQLPIRQRTWLVELMGTDQLELAETGVNTEPWKVAFGTNGNRVSAATLQSAGAAVMAIERTRHLMPAGEGTPVNRTGRKAEVARARAVVSMESGGTKKKLPGGRRKKKEKEGMSFRRNAQSQKALHKGSATMEEAQKQSAAVHGKGRSVADRSQGTNPEFAVVKRDGEMRADMSGEETAHSVAVPLFTIALRAAAKAKEEVEEGGVTWEYDAALPKPAAQQGKKVLRWKRFDPITGKSSSPNPPQGSCSLLVV